MKADMGGRGEGWERERKYFLKEVDRSGLGPFLIVRWAVGWEREGGCQSESVQKN